MKECKKHLHGSPEKYGRYVQGYLLPKFDQLRKEGRLKKGKYIRSFSTDLLQDEYNIKNHFMKENF